MADRMTKRWIRNASDELAVANGCRFDEERGQFVIDWWAKYLRLYEGDAWAGQPLIASDWQTETTMRMYGWIRQSERWSRIYKRETWIRRFSHTVIFVPKKNKKSPTLAAHGCTFSVATVSRARKSSSVPATGLRLGTLPVNTPLRCCSKATS